MILKMYAGGKRTALFFFFLFSPSLQAQWLWDTGQMNQIKGSTEKYAAAIQALRTEADRELEHPLYSVTHKAGLAPSGDKHDYVSLSRYWWPNPDTPDKLPYIYKDGESNPELNQFDRNTLGRMCGAVNTLALAYFYSDEERYAQKAVAVLRAWFLDPSTRMNPHLEYAQFIPGRNNSKGRPEGLIDSYSFVEMLNSVQLLRGSEHYTTADHEGLSRWFSDFAHWFQTSSQGMKEAAAKNNHATSYDAQMVTFYLFTGNAEAARKIIHDFPQKRIFTQIEPDGRQTHELWRTLAYHYSQYNLSHMIDLGATAQKLGLDLLNVESPDGRSFYKAMDYLTSFLGKEVDSWPYRQISGWDEEMQDICRDLIRILALDSSRKEYRELVRKYAVHDTSARWRLLFLME